MEATFTADDRPHRHTLKTVRELDVAKSDRIDLINAANDLVSLFISRETEFAQATGFLNVTPDRTDNEDAAYKAALDFLRRQFEIGPRETEVTEKRNERDETIEID